MRLELCLKIFIVSLHVKTGLVQFTLPFVAVVKAESSPRVPLPVCVARLQPLPLDDFPAQTFDVTKFGCVWEGTNLTKNKTCFKPVSNFKKK